MAVCTSITPEDLLRLNVIVMPLSAAALTSRSAPVLAHQLYLGLAWLISICVTLCNARVWDNDGEFLLIEAAYTLPRWLKPELSANRVWLSGGALHLVPLPSPAAPALPPSPSAAQVGCVHCCSLMHWPYHINLRLTQVRPEPGSLTPTCSNVFRE